MRISDVLILLLIAIVIVIAGIGYRSESQFYNSTSFISDEKQSEVFGIISNVDNYSKIKKDLKSIDVVESSGGRPQKWIETYERGFYREVELVGIRPITYFEVNVTKSRLGIVGKIKYTLSSTGSGTQVSIERETVVSNLFMRGIWVIFHLGDVYINGDVKMVRNGITYKLLGKI